jgi:hypothetical protein
MKLSQLQRHTAYIIMLAEAETFISKWGDCGFCSMIDQLFGFFVYDEKVFEKYFPELYRKRPEIFFKHWFYCK